MGFFENTVIKNKDAQDLYDTMKSHYALILQNNALDGVGNNLPKPSAFNDIASSSHKSCSKNIKKSLESILPQATLLNIDLADKSISPECCLALFRALRSKDDHNQLLWPISSLNLCGTSFCNVKVTSNSSNTNESLSTQDSKYLDRLEKLVFTELCELLRDSKSLKVLNLSSNSIGASWLAKILTFGIRMSNSLAEFHASDTNLRGDLSIPEILVEILVSSSDIHKIVSNRRILSVYRNMSLRKVYLDSNGWNLDALNLFTALLYFCPRICTLQITDSSNRNMVDDLKFNDKSFAYLLRRNTCVTEVYDHIESSMFTRPFKTKLNSFRQSVRDNKLKDKSGSIDESGPAYKWIAASEKQKSDPFHPNVFPSVSWKSGYAISVGRRSEMQDVLSMRGRFREIASNDPEKPVSFEDWWAIFDGHGGREAANYAAENLHLLFANHLDQYTNPNPADRIEAIKKAFQQCNKEMAPWNPITGTTVVAIYVHDNQRYVINLGDSRCLLYNSKFELPVFLTRDHKPNDPSEKKRIMAIQGGFIEDGRLNGKLSVSRSLGDSSLAPYVSCVPDVDVHPIDDDDMFLVLATDGLWDTLAPEGTTAADRNSGVMSTPAMLSKQLEECKEVVKIVLSCSGPSAAAKKLVEYAYNKGSSDNISVIVVFLKHQGNKTNHKTNLLRRQSGYINEVSDKNIDDHLPPVPAIKPAAVQNPLKTSLQEPLNTSAPNKADDGSNVQGSSGIKKERLSTSSTKTEVPNEHETVTSALVSLGSNPQKTTEIEKVSKTIPPNDSGKNLFEIGKNEESETPATNTSSQRTTSLNNLSEKKMKGSIPNELRKEAAFNFTRSLDSNTDVRSEEKSHTDSKNYWFKKKDKSNKSLKDLDSQKQKEPKLPSSVKGSLDNLPIENYENKDSIADVFVDEMLQLINTMKIE